MAAPAPSPLPASRTIWLFVGGVGLAFVGVLVWTHSLALALMVLSGATLAAAVFLLYSSVLQLTGQTELTLEDALTLVRPSNEEEQKRAILRALKDLEYERSVGKITEEDYRELVTRYRAEARRLLEAVQTANAEQLAKAEARAERYLAKRLQRQLDHGTIVSRESGDEPTPTDGRAPDEQDESVRRTPNSQRDPLDLVGDTMGDDADLSGSSSNAPERSPSDDPSAPDSEDAQ